MHKKTPRELWFTRRLNCYCQLAFGDIVGGRHDEPFPLRLPRTPDDPGFGIGGTAGETLVFHRRPPGHLVQFVEQIGAGVCSIFFSASFWGVCRGVCGGTPGSGSGVRADVAGVGMLQLPDGQPAGPHPPESHELTPQTDVPQEEQPLGA